MKIQKSYRCPTPAYQLTLRLTGCSGIRTGSIDIGFTIFGSSREFYCIFLNNMQQKLYLMRRIYLILANDNSVCPLTHRSGYLTI